MAPEVLIVDDNDDSREVAALLLTTEGFHCIEAANGMEALAMLKKHRPAVAVLDLFMPHMDGITLASKIREQPLFASLTLILLTA